MSLHIIRHPLILLGYMGCGKSVVGKLLAEKLQVPFEDLDQLIENELGMTISEIFEQKGEVFFRKKEHEILMKQLEKNTPSVLSLGGGTPCFYGHMEVIRKATPYSFYLKTGIPVLVGRLLNETQKRPILQYFQTEEALTEYIAKHLFERNPYYTQAQYTLTTDRMPAEAVADNIIALLK